MLNVSHLTRKELELLFHECHKHLNAVSGSRNSFHPDVIEKLMNHDGPRRNEAVEKIHHNAVLFLQRNPY